MSNFDGITEFIKKTPKTELHLHIEGSLEPELMFKLSKRNKVEIPFKSVEEIRSAYNFTNLDSFLKIYYEGSNVLINEEDLLPLYDDLNTPGYISVLHKLFDKAKSGSQKDKENFIAGCNFVGLLHDSKEDWLSFKKRKIEITEKEIASMIDQRNEARNSKNYALADKIRSELLDKGVLIEDKDGKTTWKIK